jgi:hypothetical protein
MRKTPCKECPFRKNSLAGYVGGHASFNEILGIIHYDGPFPCHMEVNKLKDDGVPFEDAIHEAGPCVGSLAYMNHWSKLPRAELVAQAKAVGKRDDCFQTPMEGMLHHDGKVVPVMPPGLTFED